MTSPLQLTFHDQHRAPDKFWGQNQRVVSAYVRVSDPRGLTASEHASVNDEARLGFVPLPAVTFIQIGAHCAGGLRYTAPMAYSRHKASTWREDMKNMLAYDIRDVPVMLGSASFLGALAGVIWGIGSASPAPSFVILSGCLAGLVAGRKLSLKAKERK